MGLLSKFADYIKAAVRTDPPPQNYRALADEMTIRRLRVLHAAMGMCTEASELLDLVKKWFFYGKPLDIEQVKLESGDLMWYTALLFDELELDLTEILDMNIRKLRARYPDKFSAENALNRNEAREEEMARRGEPTV